MTVAWVGIYVRQKMNAPSKSVVQKRRGRPPNPCLPDPVISFRLDCDLELQLEDWRSLRPQPPSRSRAISRRRAVVPGAIIAARPGGYVIYPELKIVIHSE
jgi:hypothetical protein